MSRMKMLTLSLRLACAVVVLSVPLFGTWLASSLAAWAHAPTWLALAVGLLAFPVAPLGWELRASRRRAQRLARQRERQPKRSFLTDLQRWRQDRLRLRFAERLWLRTLALNVAFVGLLLWGSPQTAFRALATRGDWMLDHVEGAWVEPARQVLLGAAVSLEWLHEWTHPDPYAELAEELPKPGPVPVLQPIPAPIAVPSPAPTRAPVLQPVAPGPARPQWPMPAELHPLVRALPPEAVSDIPTLGRYIAQHEPDPVLRAKALHDWVADNIAYDAVSLANGSYQGKQDAAQVFATRTGVCAGYVNLLVALGKAADVKFVYLTGETHGDRHAWAAVELQGSWWLLDPTWNAGYVDGTTYTERYTTDWLFVPPEVFGYTHLPEKQEWQLVSQPVSRVTFFRRQPLLPALFREGYRLVSPLEVGAPQGRELVVVLDNPRDRWMRAHVEEGRSRCGVERRDGQVEVRCAAPGPGTWHVSLFDGEAERGDFEWLGKLTVQAAH
jgi:transglutaminase-like putative cysteine protease